MLAWLFDGDSNFDPKWPAVTIIVIAVCITIYNVIKVLHGGC